MVAYVPTPGPARWLAVPALAALTVALPAVASAQEGRTVETKTIREKIQEEIEQKRQQMREGRVIRSSVRVRVRLRNGFRLTGVVKNGRFIEKPDGLAFVPADLQNADSGIRLWYYDNTNSFIFLPYSEVKNYQIGARLTDDEIRAIEERIRKAELDAMQKRREVMAREKAREDAARRDENRATAARNEAGQEDEGPTLSPLQQQLLADYPPEAGWGADRMREIEIRKMTVGVFPDSKSKRFVENFEEWLKGKEIRDAREKLEAEAEASGTGKGGSDGSGGSKSESNSAGKAEAGKSTGAPQDAGKPSRTNPFEQPKPGAGPTGGF